MTTSTASQSKGNPFAMALVSVLFLLIGSGVAWWGWNILQDAKESATWPSVQGVVTQSSVRHKQDSDGGDTYTPEVAYEYTVKGRSYRNDTIKFGQLSYSNRGDAESVVSPYPTGRKLKVYYEPSSPEKSVLEPGTSNESYLVLGIGAFFVVISLIMAPITFVMKSRKVI